MFCSHLRICIFHHRKSIPGKYTGWTGIVLLDDIAYRNHSNTVCRQEWCLELDNRFVNYQFKRLQNNESKFPFVLVLLCYGLLLAS